MIRMLSLFVVLLLALVLSYQLSMALEITVLIGDKDCYDQGAAECIGPDVADINGMAYAIEPFVNRTDSVMNDNIAMSYRFSYVLPSNAVIDSAFITVNALDVEAMGDSSSTPVTPVIDGWPLIDQALRSVPKPWGSPGPSDRYSTQTVLDISSYLYLLRDGFAVLEFPRGNHGDNVAFDFVELKIYYHEQVSETETYEFVTSWGSCGTNCGEFGADHGPLGIAVVESNLYIADYSNQRVLRTGFLGEDPTCYLIGRYIGEIQYYDGYFYLQQRPDQVNKFDMNFNPVGAPWPVSFPVGGWCTAGLTVDSFGYVHVSSCYTDYLGVYRISPDGQLLGRYGQDVLSSPNSLLATEDFIYVGDGNQIKLFRPDGQYIGVALSLPPGVIETGHNSLAIDEESNIYVGCSDLVVRKYAPDGTLLASIGSGFGSGPGEFTGIYGIAIDNKGYLYVCDGGGGEACSGNRRIQVFRPTSPELNAPYTSNPVTIDGYILSSEWQDANRYDIPFIRQNGIELQNITVYFKNDGTYLYCAAQTPFSTHEEAYFGIYIDGDHSHSFNGQLVEPHIDIGYNKAGSDSPKYPIYDAYWRLVDCDVQAVTPPSGAEHAYTGPDSLAYEFKIPLSDLAAAPNDTVGLNMHLGTGVPDPGQGGYHFPSIDYCNISQWSNLFIQGLPVGIAKEVRGVPACSLSQNYPNPFNPQTVIEYSISSRMHVRIAVYDIMGRLVKVLVNETQVPGTKSVVWNGTNERGERVASGVYFYQLRTNNLRISRKMVLIN